MDGQFGYYIEVSIQTQTSHQVRDKAIEIEGRRHIGHFDGKLRKGQTCRWQYNTQAKFVQEKGWLSVS